MAENTENKAVETEETETPKKETKAKVSKKDEETSGLTTVYSLIS